MSAPEPYKSLAEALFAAQAACPASLAHDDKFTIKGRDITYTSSEQIVAALKPILHAHGLVWSMAPSGADGKVSAFAGLACAVRGEGQFARPSAQASWLLEHPATKEARTYTVELFLAVGDLAMSKATLAAWTTAEGYALRRLLMLPTGEVEAHRDPDSAAQVPAPVDPAEALAAWKQAAINAGLGSQEARLGWLSAFLRRAATPDDLKDASVLTQAASALATRLFSEAQASDYAAKWTAHVSGTLGTPAREAPRGPDPQSSGAAAGAPTRPTSTNPTAHASGDATTVGAAAGGTSSGASSGIQNAPPANAGPDPVITTRLDRLIKQSREARIAAGLDLVQWRPIVNEFAGLEVCGTQGFEPVKELNGRGALTAATLDRWQAGLERWVASRAGGAA